MKIYRTTHDKAGKYKFDNCWPLEQEINQHIHGLGVHALNASNEPTTFEEYFDCNVNHHQEYGSPIVGPPTALELLEDLILMIKTGACEIH